MRCFHRAAVCLCVCIASVHAQPESDNVGHTRHHHPHNEKHKTSDDQTRFFTDRDSDVQLPLPSEEDAFSFVIFGDRTGGPDDGVAILADAVRDTNLIEPDLVITVGDLIQGYGETGPWMTQMHEYKGVMDNLLCPWFPVAGNHDTYWRNKGSGESKPEGEMDDLYEMHFGPLWYSFSHKNNHFIVLYTDEGNPETGEKTFHKPESQRMSPEQRSFLEGALKRGKDADHIFVFVHHPRWLGGGYGDDWDSVHEMLADAGNVAAVFAGHIHYMRYDGPKDGIEYVSLATTGGHKTGEVADAGFLHHYDLVTVRKDQIALSSIPVGALLDVRDITGELAKEANELSENGAQITSSITFADDGSVDEYLEGTVVNTSSFPVDFTLTADSADSRWHMHSNHHHGRLAAGESRTLGFRVLRRPDAIDEDFRVINLILDRELLTKSFRYTIPSVHTPVPLDASTLPKPPLSMHEQVLRTGSKKQMNVVAIDDESFELPQGPFTLECWFKANEFSKRTGLVAKTEGSDYGFFVNVGQPAFSVRLNGKYTTARAQEAMLETDRWYHIAGVYDGQEVRLYIDGQLVASERGSGRRDTNAFPLMVGSDVNSSGKPTSPFNGMIDEVRLSSGTRYQGGSFSPARWHKDDDQTRLLLHMNGQIGPWIFDDSKSKANGRVIGDAHIVTVHD